MGLVFTSNKRLTELLSRLKRLPKNSAQARLARAEAVMIVFTKLNRHIRKLGEVAAARTRFKPPKKPKKR